MHAALGYKDRICDLYPGDPTADGAGTWFENLFSTTTVGTGPAPEVPVIHQLLCTNGTGIGRRNAFEVLELDDHRIQLRTLERWNAPEGYSTYLSQADPAAGGGLIGLRYVTEPGERETFRFISLADDESVFALETSYGRFVTAERDGNGSPLTSDRDVIGEWQRFMFLEVPAELLPEPEREPSLADQLVGTVDQADLRDPVTDAIGTLDTGPSAADRTSAVTTAGRGSSLREKIFGRRK